MEKLTIEAIEAIEVFQADLTITTSTTISKSNKFAAEGGNADVKVGDEVLILAGAKIRRTDYEINNVKITGDVLVGFNVTSGKPVKISIGSMNRRYFEEKVQIEGTYPNMEASVGFDNVKFNKLSDSYELKASVKLVRNVNINGFDIASWVDGKDGKKTASVKNGKVVTEPKKFTSYTISLAD